MKKEGKGKKVEQKKATRTGSARAKLEGMMRKPEAPGPRKVMKKQRKMTRAEAVKFERALVEEKRRILRQGSIAEKIMESCAPSATGDLSMHRTHTADQGTENYQREMASRLRSIEATTLREIEDALRRIADGSYGTCEKCGAPIPKARLEVVPHARFCMKCLQEK